MCFKQTLKLVVSSFYNKSFRKVTVTTEKQT